MRYNHYSRMCFLRWLLVSVLFWSSEGDVFSSMATMEKVLSWERDMLSEVKTYMKAEEGKIIKMKEVVSKLEQSIGKVTTLEDVKRYLGNPINSYLTIKRVNEDWKKIERIVEKDYGEDLTRGMESLKPIWPTQIDQTGAIDAIFRLQKTYLLKSDSLAHGIIDGVSGHWEHVLNIDDILMFGQQAYQKKLWPLAAQWLQTTLDVYYSDDYNGKWQINTTKVMDHLAQSYYMSGDVEKAHEVTLELSRRLPEDEGIANNLDVYQEKISLQKKLKKVGVGGKVDQKTSEKDLKGVTSTPYAEKKKLYEKLCRGETQQPTKREHAKLKCWYRSKNPLLRLKPQKVERLWVRPEILLFHDMISDKQSKTIIDIAYPNLQRAGVGRLNKIVDFRVSKFAWISPYYHFETWKMLKRAEAVTGLDMAYSEPLQVGNYGMGGHYMPHFDHTRDGEAPLQDGMGNRIATLMFYLSDVSAGGATVFTKAKTAVYPVKNAAIFWYNLKRNGKSNDMTMHAACPVLLGQKWVSNWWIGEHGQEFRRPCAQKQNW